MCVYIYNLHSYIAKRIECEPEDFLAMTALPAWHVWHLKFGWPEVSCHMHMPAMHWAVMTYWPGHLALQPPTCPGLVATPQRHQGLWPKKMEERLAKDFLRKFQIRSLRSLHLPISRSAACQSEHETKNLWDRHCVAAPANLGTSILRDAAPAIRRGIGMQTTSKISKSNRSQKRSQSESVWLRSLKCSQTAVHSHQGTEKPLQRSQVLNYTHPWHKISPAQWMETPSWSFQAGCRVKIRLWQNL